MSINKKISSVNKKFLGEILLERGVITEYQLQHALDVQQEQGGHFGEILINLGYIEEQDIVVALVVQCHIPYIAIDKYDIDQSIIQLIPEDIVRKYRIVPLDRVNTILSIVMSNPLDMAARAEVERATHCRLAPFIASQSEVNRAIHRWYDRKI